MYFSRTLLHKLVTSKFHNNIRRINCKSTVHKKYPISCNFPKKCSGSSTSSLNNQFGEGLELHYRVDFKAITGGNNEKLTKLKILLTDLQLKLEMGIILPRVLDSTHWKKLLKYDKFEQRAFLKHRLLVENSTKIRENEKIKNQNNFNEQKCSKGLFCETIIERASHFYNFKLLKSMIYGPHIVIDCGFEDTVPKKYIWDLAYHMYQIWFKNRMNQYPSHIIYCNVDLEGELFSSFMELFSDTKCDPAFPLSWTEKSYLELFPRETLVYLSPDSRFTMERFDGNKVYIIGGLVPQVHEPVTFEKAVDEDLLTNKIPLEKHVDWGAGPKKLSIVECVSLLNDLKDGCHWDIAFRHVSKTKWAHHALDEKQTQRFPNYRRPSESIQRKYREDFMRSRRHL